MSACPCVKFYPVYDIMAMGGEEIWLHLFLTSTLYSGEWSVSRPNNFDVGHPLIGRQGGPHGRSGRNARKINVLLLATIKLRFPGHSVRSLYTVATTLNRLQVSSPITIQL
jgi:hypothetical protein